jgi:single-strand DNA-binding protein
MSDHVTVHGLVATEPRHLVTKDGLEITSFRLAAMQRRFDRQLGKWRDDGTNWYSIASFRILAKNAAASLEKGHRVIVSGRLKVREWDAGERSGVSVDIEADSIGHDLVWGSSSFERNRMPVDQGDEVDESTAEDPDEPEGGDDTF